MTKRPFPRTDAEFEQYHAQLRGDLAQGRRIFSGGMLCSFCAFWQPAAEGYQFGSCRRYPKAVTTAYYDFCGEHAHVPDYSEQLAAEAKETAA